MDEINDPFARLTSKLGGHQNRATTNLTVYESDNAKLGELKKAFGCRNKSEVIALLIDRCEADQEFLKRMEWTKN